jgi:hypothetical protein
LSETLRNQTHGLEAVSLLVVAPLSVVIGVLARRGHRAAPYVGVAIGAYTAYMLVQYIVGPSYLDYPRVLPLQLGLFVLGWVVALRGRSNARMHSAFPLRTVSPVEAPRWPEADLQAMGSPEGSWHKGSVVCRRGHRESAYLDPRKSRHIPEMCPKCGARLLIACPECGLRIRGDYFVPGVVGFATPDLSSFCDGCGAAFPWATREERIFELENLLDEEEIDEADLTVIHDHLERLRDAAMSDGDERAAWEIIKRRAGAALNSGPVRRVVEGLASAAIRQQLGL